MQGEYRGDFSRDGFNPLKHFSRVLMQQGRVQLDADWNEQAAIQQHYLRRLAADLIGPFAGVDDGFKIVLPPAGASADLLISPGHYYVNGLLCENESQPLTLAPVTGPGQGNRFAVLPGISPEPDIDFKGRYGDLSRPGNPPGVAPGTHVVVRISDWQLGEATDRNRTLLTLEGELNRLGDPTEEEFPYVLRMFSTYANQPDLRPRPLTAPGVYLAYLDVWERHICAVQDDSIREIALGGPDTAARARLTWQVRTVLWDGPQDANRQDVEERWPELVERWQAADRGLLRAQLKPEDGDAGPCVISPESRYRGAENQLYRVEIHTGTFDDAGNAAQPSFKWSRENGSVVFPVLQLSTEGSSQTIVELADLGRDDRLGLAEGDWVEIVDYDYTLSNRAERLLKVRSIDPVSMTVILDGVPQSNVGTEVTRHPLLRRWDQKQGDSQVLGFQLNPDGTIPIPVDGDWRMLEDAIRVQFLAQAKTRYRTGDYWLIPARTATGDIDWPRLKDKAGNLVLKNDDPVPCALPPHGVEHHFAPLALAQFAGGAQILDLRRLIVPMTGPAPP